MNEKLQAIQTQASMAFRALWLDAEEEIAVAIARAVEDAQAAETECVFTIGFQVQLDFGKDKQRHKLTFGNPRKYESESTMPNPAQKELPLEEVPESDIPFERGPDFDGDGNPPSPELREAARKFLAVMEGGGSVTAGGKTVEFKKGA